MGTLIPNSFTSYELTPEETKVGSTFTHLQKQVIQNHISILAEERLQLAFDPLNPINFAQQEAEKKGAIQALQYLLELSALAVEDTNS